MRCGEFRRHQQRDVAADSRPVVARRPGDQHLRLGEQQRAQPVALRLKCGDLDPQPQFGPRGADAGAHQQDCSDDGKAEQRQRGGQNREFLMIEVEPGRNRIRNGAIGGRGGPKRQQ